MNKKCRRKKNITLIEIIIVMFFITIITGVVAYNVKGALDEGKAFRTVESMKQLRNILELELASDDDSQQKISNGDWKIIVKEHPLVKNPKNIIKDGWGQEFSVEVVSTSDGEDKIKVSSARLNAYQAKHSTLFKDDELEEE
ncbi:MAG: type II secretion system protein [Chlamydiota bacterium]